MKASIARSVADWQGDMLFYPAIKALTLDLAADSFIGIPWGPEAARINTAFVDMVQASVGVVRKPLPWDVREITAAIDKLPLRRQEVLERNPAGR